MKEKVLNYLRTNRGFAAGLALLQTIPGANLAMINRLSRMGDSPANLSHLHYDMVKLVGISEAELAAISKQPLQAEAPAAPEVTAAPEGSETDLVFNPEINYPQLKTAIKQLGLEVLDQKKDTLLAAYNAYFEQKKS